MILPLKSLVNICVSRNHGFLTYTGKSILLILLIAGWGISYSQPVVVTQPQDTSICVESSASFSIVAVNTSGYQWQEFDGVGWYNLDNSFTYVNGETTPVLTINDANLALNGYQYRCIVNDLVFNRDTSQPATLGVYEPPIITSQPLNQRVCKSEIALFSISAINGSSFQWQEYNGVGWLSIEDNSFYSGSQTADLSVYTVTGMDGFLFRCIVKNVSCPDTSESALLNVDPTPVLYSITGGGDYCEGGNGVEIGLSGSELGISYNLLLDGIETGVVKEGSGSSLSFGNQTAGGIYTVIAYNQFTSCEIAMGGEAVVSVLPLPSDFQVMGGGSVCEDGPYPEIYLLNSETDVDYTLYHNAQSTGITISGTGYGINFGEQQAEGFYTVMAENTTTGCLLQMSGSPEVIVYELPLAIAGPDQSVIQGSTAFLQGSASGGSGSYNYEWSPSALCVSPTTVSTQTNSLYQSTIFEFVVTDAQNGCVSLPDTAIVYVGSGPLNVIAYASQNNICGGETVNLIAVAGGGTGNYTYTWTSSPPGFVSTSSTVIVSPGISTNYIIALSDGLETVYDTVSVNVFALPQTYAVSGGGSFCEGGDGVDISLNGSETGVRYNLFLGLDIVEDKFGTGQPITFNNIVQEGNYTITAKNESTYCETEQLGSATVSINELPVAEAGPNNLINAGSFATLDGSATGGSGGYNYSWTPADSLINPASSDPSTVPLYSTNMFQLAVTDNSGCTSEEDNTIVFVSGGQISLSILTSGFPVCPGEDVQLYAMASGGSGSFTYFWQSSPPGFSSTTFDPIVSPEETTTYIVTVNDGLTVVTDSITVIIDPAPTPYQLVGGGTVCSGQDPQNIVLQGSDNNVDYQLYLNGSYTGSHITGNGFALNFGVWNDAGEYTVYAQNPVSGCDNYMLGNVQIVVNPLPVADAGPDQIITQGSSVALYGSANGSSGSYNYQWQPSYLCSTPNNQNTSTLPISQTTQFTLEVTDVQSQCISIPDTTIIFTEGDNLYVTATVSPSQICTGEEVMLSATAGGGTGNFTYSWTSIPSGFYSSSASTNDFPQSNISYIIEVYDGINSIYDTVHVSVNPLPVEYLITGGGGFCIGGDGVEIGLSGSQSGISYGLYRTPDIFVKDVVGSGSAISFGLQTQQGDYYSMATNSSNCSSNMLGEVDVVVNTLPVGESGDDITISYGNQTVLNGSASNGSGNYSFLWEPSDSLVSNNISSPLTIPLHNTTQFSLVVTDVATGCESIEDNSVVFVSGGPFTLQTIANKPSVCKGEMVQLSALASGGSGVYTYVWTSSPAGFSSNIYNPTVNPQITTTYYVSVNDGTTILNDSVQISVNQLPIEYLVSGGGTVCEGENPENIVISGSETSVLYSLLKDGIITGQSLNGNGFALDFGLWNEEGFYSVFGENQSTLCNSYMTGSAVVQVNENPVANAGPDLLADIGSVVTLSGGGSGGSGSYYYQWEPSYLCQTPLNQNTHTQPLSQTMVFTHNVTDVQTLCESETDSAWVYILGDELYVIAGASSGQVCEGEQVLLSATTGGGTGNYSYSWTSIPQGFNSTSITPTVIPITTTNYIVDVFDGVSHAFDTIEIQVIPDPVVYQITGGGSYCDGELGIGIGLSGSEAGMIYKLFREPQIFVKQLSGTGQALDFGLHTEPGNYYCEATSVSGCTNNMVGDASIVINPVPIAYAGDNQTVIYNTQATLSGSASPESGTYNYFWTPGDSLINPSSSQTLTVPLHTSNVFNLHVSETNTGCISDESTTLVLVAGGPFSLQTNISEPVICKNEQSQLFAMASGGSGSYTYLWTSDPPGFSSTVYNPIIEPSVSTTYYVAVNDGTTILNGQVSIQVNQLPAAYSVTGGGNVCNGEISNDILLSNSQTGILYTLLRNGQSTGNIIEGSGFPLNFGGQTIEGSYTVYAIENTYQCENNMAGTANVSVSDLPSVNAGEDLIIPKNTTTTLSGGVLSGSGSYSYLWQPIALCQNPYYHTTGTSPISQSTLFTFQVTDLQSSCESLEDTVMVFTTGDELSVTILASTNNICTGETVQLTAMPTGGSGTYTFSWFSDPSGFISNQINPTVSPLQSTTYYVEVSDGVDIVIDSVYINVLSFPNVYTISGGGEYCEGGIGAEIFLDGSDQGIVYRLYRYPDIPVSDVVGTGMSISFGAQTITGNYHVIANPDFNCSNLMNGTAGISAVSNPVSNAGDDKYISWLGQVQLNGSASGGSGNYLYNWVPADSLINPAYKEPLTIPLHSTTLFNLNTIDSETGCTGNDDQVVVYISGGPLSVNVTTLNDLICEGDESQLFALSSGGSGSYSYLWLSDPPGFTSNISSPIISPGVTTKYTVIVNDGTTTVTDSIIINVNPSPMVYNLIGGGEFCSGEQGLDVKLTGSQAGTNYELLANFGNTGQILTGSGDTLNFGLQDLSGYYWVIANEINLGCESPMADTVEIIESDSPLANAGDDQFILEGTSTQLFGNASNGTGFYNYNWFPDYLLVDPAIQNPLTEVLNQTSLFNIIVEDDGTGCNSDSDTVIVYMTNTGLTLNISASPETICEGGEVNLSALPGGGTGNYSYCWTSNPLGFYSNSQFPSDYPEITTTYIAEISDGDSTIIDSIVVEVVAAPAVYEVTGGGNYCFTGSGVSIGLSGSQLEIEYTLVLDNGSEVKTIEGTGSSLLFGEYKVSGIYTVHARNKTTSCVSQMAGNAVLAQYPQPIADAGSDIYISTGEHANLSGTAEGGFGVYNYLWSPPEKLLNPNDPDPTTLPLNTTTLFTLEVVDVESGCISAPSNMIVFISGGPLNVDIISNQNKVCPGEQLELFALPGGGMGDYSYYWESDPPGFNATSSEVTVMPTQQTWYKVTVHDGTDYISDSIFIETFTKPAAYNLLGGGGYCPDSDGVEVYLQNSQPSTTYSLFHNAQYTGQYITGTGGSVSFGKILTEGNYSVEAQNNLGCKSLMNNVVMVDIYPLPERFQLYGGGEYCENDPTLGLLLESSQSSVQYELFIDAVPSGITKNGTGLPLSFDTFAGTGNYSVIATGIESGCLNPMLGVAGLIINPNPEILITGESNICDGAVVDLFGSGGISYEWNTDPPQYTPTITVNPDQTTSYVLVGYNQIGCSDTASHQVIVNQAPSISLINNEVSMIIVCEPDTLSNYIFTLDQVVLQEGVENTWYYGEIGLLSDTINVLAISDSGCKDSTSIFVEMKEAANAFTPNGDGKNDRFMEGHEITVFSSWGGELYHGDEGWDGNFNGNPVVPGTYYYIHHIYDLNGTLIKTLRGSVTVVRE